VVGADGNLTCTDKDNNETKLTVEVNGSKPTAGTIELTNGKITKVTGMILDGKELKKENGKVTIVGDSTEGPVVPSIPEDPKDTSGAVVDLPDGLTPVVYKDNEWQVADTSKSWYNYDNQEWANAVLLKNNISKNTGDTINVSSDVQAMFVYVPRYEYKIEGQYGTHTDGTAGTAALPGEIKVNVVSKETTTVSNGYTLHPAFTFGTKELNGIWVGKFETSTDQTSLCYTDRSVENCDNAEQIPYILPNVNSLTYQKISNQFLTAQKFNIYINSSNIDAHMMKNSEWGAVAYLSQSKYGKYGNKDYIGVNKSIYQNRSNNSSATPYKTGKSSGSPSSDSLSQAQCGYDDIVDRGEGKGACGAGASTTGNITGIYDMNGGGVDRVMGILANDSGIPYSGKSPNENSGFNGPLGQYAYRDEIYTSGMNFPDEKYYDKYTTTNVPTACNGEICYGHALSETNGWYGNRLEFPVSDWPWIQRGIWSKFGGMYEIYRDSGGTSFDTVFHVVLS